MADANTPNALFTTDMIGDYVLTLIAWDGLLWSDPDAMYVIVEENLPPVAVATTAPLSGPAPLMVLFDALGGYDPEGGLLFYGWSFGDLTYGTGPAPTHVYTDPGIYTVRLGVTDDFGNDDIAFLDITVGEASSVPEPVTLALMGLGLAGIGWKRRKAA